MALEQRKVREIVKQAVGKTVDIPEFQRAFVWDAEKVKLLAESLYRDYPVGSFLLWDSSSYSQARTAKGTEPSSWIVDGQQRTTALCLLMGMKPYWWPETENWNDSLKRYDVMVNIAPEREEGRLEFSLPNPIRQLDPKWISLKSFLNKENVEELTILAQEISEKISKNKDESMYIFGKIHARLQSVWQIRERDIPIVKISHEVEDVAEIFARLNQQGTRVKEADVVLAIAAVGNPGWVREDYLPYYNDLSERGWDDLDAGIFIRTMIGIGHGRAHIKDVPRNFWNPPTLREAWVKTKSSISETIKRLSEFGIFSPKLLPSTNSLVPLFVLNNKWRNQKDYKFGKSLKWFLLANQDGRYSGSAITSMNEDVRTIMELETFEDVLKKLFERLEVDEIQDEDFLHRYDKAGNRYLQLMLYLIMFRNQAVDWIDKTRIGYDKSGSPISSGFEPQWHHIFPKSKLRNENVREEDIHALANMTIQNEKTNIGKLTNRDPYKYIIEFNISPKILEGHLIPETFLNAVYKYSEDKNSYLIESIWNYKKYDDFITNRATLLAKKAREFLAFLDE